ncbi:hypothetical protein evm_005843 [Chilo suppressalis]|nr:hypothetical protein evm_005843 [Chilo suppressalis]
MEIVTVSIIVADNFFDLILKVMEFIELILINKLDGVILKYPHNENVDGTVCITGHHLILSSRKEGVRELWLLHKNIDSIEKKENKPTGGITQGGSLFLKCKDLKIFQLDIASSTDLNLMAQTLENLSSLQDPSLYYPFFYRHMHPIVENGYTLYSVEEEFTKVLATEEWRVSRVNLNYAVCSSYGKAVVVPKSIDDETLAAAATFRQGGRFPVLAYRHNNGAVLMRAGQPLYGPKHRRCRPDEAILNTVVAVGTKGVIYDLRSSNLISQQQNKGGGTESNSNYSQWKIYNRSMDDVDNQQQLLESYSKFIEACNDREISSDKWISKLESCGWPESVRNSLHTACIVAQHIHQAKEVCRLLIRLLQKLHDINSSGKSIKLQWVPSHIGISGNEEADRLAKEASIEGENASVEPFYSETLSKYIKSCYLNWKEYFDEISKEKGIWYKTIQSQPLRIPWFINLTSSRHFVVTSNRLRSGHYPCNKFGHFMKKIESPNCEVCCVVEDLQHLLMDCVRYQNERQEFVKKCKLNMSDIGVFHSILAQPVSEEARMLYGCGQSALRFRVRFRC